MEKQTSPCIEQILPHTNFEKNSATCLDTYMTLLHSNRQEFRDFENDKFISYFLKVKEQSLTQSYLDNYILIHETNE